MDEERTGEAFEFDEQLTVVGSKLSAGQMAPEFVLDLLEDDAINTVALSSSNGSVRLLNVVNSLDTPVCDVETRRWDALRSRLPAGSILYTISMDLPFAQARWCGSSGVGHLALSAHRSERFGRDYGVLIKEWRMLQRAVFVIDEQGLIVYCEYVADQMTEPDYEAALAAAHDATGVERVPN